MSLGTSVFVKLCCTMGWEQGNVWIGCLKTLVRKSAHISWEGNCKCGDIHRFTSTCTSFCLPSYLHSFVPPSCIRFASRPRVCSFLISCTCVWSHLPEWQSHSDISYLQAAHQPTSFALPSDTHHAARPVSSQSGAREEAESSPQ